MYREHFDFVWRCLRALGVPASGIDDAAQEVFVAAHRRLSHFRGSSSVRSWLYGIVRNVASNARRALRRKGDVVALREDTPNGEPGPFERTAALEAAAFMQRFLRQLDDKKREVFVLAVLEDMSMPEVAASLGIPLNTAYTRARTARLAFQRAAERERGGHAGA